MILDRIWGVGMSGGDARWWPSLLSSVPTRSGVVVDEHASLTLPAIFRAVDNLASHIAMLPVHVLRWASQDERERDRSHRAEFILNRQASIDATAINFRRSLNLHAILWGNGRAEVVRNDVADANWLRLMLPHRTTTKRDDNGNIVHVEREEDGKEKTYKFQDVVHIAGLGYDTVAGYGLIGALARENIGLGLAIQQYASSFFGNNTMLGIVLSTDKYMDPQARRDYQEQFSQEQRGPQQAFKAVMLDGGIKLNTLTQPNEASQTLELMTFSVQDVARWLNVPPPLLHELSHATYSNIEQLGLWYVKYTLMPWLHVEEQEFGLKLLSEQERNAGYYLKFNAEGLLRGDIKTRMESYQMALLNGILSIDEVRALEDRNALPNGAGQEHRVPMNTVPAGETEEEPAGNQDAVDDEPESQDESQTETAGRNTRLFKKSSSRTIADAVSRVLHKETLAATRAAKRYTNVEAFDSWAAKFYANGHRQCIVDAVTPSVECLAELVVGSENMTDNVTDAINTVVGYYADEHISESLSGLRDAYPGKDVEGLCELWQISRPGQGAIQLTDQTVTAVTVAFEERTNGPATETVGN